MSDILAHKGPVVDRRSAHLRHGNPGRYRSWPARQGSGPRPAFGLRCGVTFGRQELPFATRATLSARRHDLGQELRDYRVTARDVPRRDVENLLREGGRFAMERFEGPHACRVRRVLGR